MLKSFMAGDRADGLMTDITAGDAMAVLSLRHLRRGHHDLGHGAFAAQRKQALFNIAQHRFRLVSEHSGGR